MFIGFFMPLIHTLTFIYELLFLRDVFLVACGSTTTTEEEEPSSLEEPPSPEDDDDDDGSSRAFLCSVLKDNKWMFFGLSQLNVCAERSKYSDWRFEEGVKASAMHVAVRMCAAYRPICMVFV